MRTLVIAHVYYPQLWPELAASIRNVTEPRDIVVTYGEESAIAEARRDFPGAKFLLCENVGYDIWPFLKALRAIDLTAYDLIVKVHTKRDMTGEYAGYCCNDSWFGGSRWRQYLLAPFATRRSWCRTVGRFADPTVGMVADRHVVFAGNAQSDDREVFDRACELVGTICGETLREGDYVAGTMFTARPAALTAALSIPCEAEDFGQARDGRFLTLAHVLERVLGLSVRAAGMRIEAFNGSVERRRKFYAKIGLWNRLLRFLFYRRYLDGEVKVKACGIQLRHRQLGKDPK